MTEHVSKSRMERFCVTALPSEELAIISKHLSNCQPCHQLLTETLASQRGTSGIRFTLAPEFWLRHEHLDYEQLAELADNRLEADDRELIESHLEICPTCREDVRSFLAFRREIEPEMNVSFAPVAQSLKPTSIWPGWLRGALPTPPYAVAVIALIVIAVIAILILRSRTGVFEALQTPPGPSPNEMVSGPPSPSPRTSELASNSATPVTSPSPKKAVDDSSQPGSRSADIIALNDDGTHVTVNRSGNVTGLDEIPTDVRSEIATAILSERLAKPVVLNTLAPDSSVLRGNGNTGPPFRLVSPGRAVIVENDPTFKWEKLPGASTYRVYVLDPRGHQVVKSDDLPSTSTEWKSSALNRGNIYSWVVIAFINGKEIVSPGAAAHAMKFQVLSANDLQKLNGLKATHSHLALGVFYAKVGLLNEAKHEFEELLRLNPDSKTVGQLLRSVESLRKTPSP